MVFECAFRCALHSIVMKDCVKEMRSFVHSAVMLTDGVDAVALKLLHCCLEQSTPLDVDTHVFYMHAQLNK
jgi:hypothetical protein